MKKHARAAPRIPLWTLLFVSLSLSAFLGAQFLEYQTAISVNGDIMAYKRTAVTINAIRSGKTVEVPNYYPPLANILFLSAENNMLSLPFHRALLLLFIGALGGACVFLSLTVGDHVLRWLIVAIPATIALLEPAVFFARFDGFPMLAIILAALSFRKKLYGFAGGLLMLGCMLKLAPVFLIPVMHFIVPRGQRRRFWGGLGLAALGVLCTSFIILGFGVTLESIAAFFTLRTAYPPYALSTASGVDLFVRMLSGGTGVIEWIAPDIGHFNTGLPVWISPILLLIAAAGAGWITLLASRDPRREQNVVLYVSATMMWLLVATPLLTMHYYLWVLPLILFWFLEQAERAWKITFWHGIAGASAIAVALLGQWTYPTLYFDLVDHQTALAVTVNFLRNAVAFLLVVALLKSTKETAFRA